MDFENIITENKNDIIYVTLNRPDVRNAFNAELINDLYECFAQLAVNESIRGVVLGGTGKVFCAGADINWMKESVDYTEEQNHEDAMKMARMFQAIDQCPHPVIGRIQKAAFGGAVGLAAVCDIVVASNDTKFSFSEVRLGIVPAVISSFSLRKIGISQARRFFLTGEVFTADVAKEIGLIHEIVPETELDQVVQKLLGELKKSGPNAVREAKVLAHIVPDLFYDDALEYCAETISKVRTSDEGQSGLNAFLNKQKAPWIEESESP